MTGRPNESRPKLDLSYDARALASSGRTLVNGVMFDFNPPVWPAFPPLGEDWAAENLANWLEQIGVETLWPGTLAEAAPSGIFLGCRVHAYAARALGPPADTPLFAKFNMAAAMDVRLRVVAPDGAECNLLRSFMFRRHASAYVGFESIRERIAREVAADPCDITDPPEGSQEWRAAAQAFRAMRSEMSELVSALSKLRDRDVPEDVAPLGGYGPDVVALADLIERALIVGYLVRSAEVQPFQNPAVSGLAAIIGGGKGGKTSGESRRAKAERWKVRARPLLIESRATSEGATVEGLALAVQVGWKDNDPAPSLSSLKLLIAEMVREGTLSFA